MGNPHILVIPFPALGHITPLLELSQSLVLEHGIKITFVVTEDNRQRVMHSLATNQIRLVSIPNEQKSRETMFEEYAFSVMPGKVKQLIEEMNTSDSDKITCIIADFLLGWGMQVAAEKGIKGVVFSGNMGTGLVLISKIPKLIDDGIIDHDGDVDNIIFDIKNLLQTSSSFSLQFAPRAANIAAHGLAKWAVNRNGNVTKKQMLKLSPTMPSMSTSHFPWASLGIPKLQKLFFEHASKNNKSLEMAEWVLCNSAYELEPATFDTEPKIRPVGPLLEKSNLSTNSSPEDSTCLKWLDQQSPQSVIYVAFGTTTFLSQTEFKELALGLELCNRPFLWVVRSDITRNLKDAYPDGFLDRVGSRGLIISWSPQKRVLEHPCIACFLFHCGWNSTLEALSNGVPLLCWPTFADQFLNGNYICNVWKIGLGFNRDDNNIITREEIKKKVEELLRNEAYKANALDLKQKLMKSIKEGGRSYNNLKGFVEWMKT